MIGDLNAIKLINQYFCCLRQQATNDNELCIDTVKACSSGFTESAVAELTSSDKGVQFIESVTSILSQIVEFSKNKELMHLVIKLVLDTLLCVAENNPALQIAVMSFLAKFISVKWRLFFPGGLMQMVQPNQNNKKPEINHLDIVTKVIDCFINATISTLVKPVI